MDEFDAPLKTPVEHGENCDVLKEIEEQTCLLFEEFLRLDDHILDCPKPAGRLRGFASEQKEICDSPVYKSVTKTRVTWWSCGTEMVTSFLLLKWFL
ncbi:hypothetical protein AC249_AIPGENE20051 [Exaiptasia diaphana]|nr:hypothetical protein AC249_AIPGENE20051 [Exaiptasia diaphana]